MRSISSPQTGSGLIYEAAFVFLATNVKTQRFTKTADARVGDENLLVRSATLGPGDFAFVAMADNELQGARPGNICFPFRVTGAAAAAGAAAQAGAPRSD